MIDWLDNNFMVGSGGKEGIYGLLVARNKKL